MNVTRHLEVSSVGPLWCGQSKNQTTFLALLFSCISPSSSPPFLLAGSGRVNLVPLPPVVASPRDMALAAVICSALATVLLALLVLCVIYCKRQLLEKKPSGESQHLLTFSVSSPKKDVSESVQVCLGSHFNTRDAFHAPLRLLSMGCTCHFAVSIELRTPSSPGASMHTQWISCPICSVVKISKMKEKLTLYHIFQNIFSYQKNQTKKIHTVISYPKCVIRLCALRCSEQAVQYNTELLMYQCCAKAKYVHVIYNKVKKKSSIYGWMSMISSHFC